ASRRVVLEAPRGTRGDLPHGDRLSHRGADGGARRGGGAAVPLLDGGLRRADHGVGRAAAPALLRPLPAAADEGGLALGRGPPAAPRRLPALAPGPVPARAAQRRPHAAAGDHLVREPDVARGLLARLVGRADPQDPHAGPAPRRRAQRSRL
ncbi:MAG: hypothetical protein AVDCRST_MAG64-2892, partial [uncultured Phycisphaerae bacterium]